MGIPAANAANGHSPAKGLSWLQILRLGLVQAALGAIVVLTTSTLNRVMIVELGLAAVIPGLLVGIHYGIQITRPVWGHRSDTGSSRTRWILGGLALLALSGTGAASTTLLFEINLWIGLAAAVVAYLLIGIGVGACGTSLLALMATETAPERRAAAATITWMLMIAGIVVTSIITGINLEPYSHERLILVTAITGAIVFVIAMLALTGIEARPSVGDNQARKAPGSFRDSFQQVWSDGEARLFTLFIFVSMLAYSTQDLILEPYAGLLFGMTPGQTTQLSGTQHAGVFVGMAIVGIVGSLLAKSRPGMPKFFMVSGCFGSAAALAALSVSALFAPVWPLQANIFLLGLMNGAFAVAAVGTMMVLAGAGKKSNEGMRMGVWGAAQAISFGLGGVMGTVVLEIGRAAFGKDTTAFTMVFALEALMFLMSALIALRIGQGAKRYKATALVHSDAVPAE